MIKYDLECRKEHVFEAWFADSDSCDEQIEASAVSCPVCGDVKVRKTLMAPSVTTGRKKDAMLAKQSVAMSQYLTAAREFRRKVEENCDYVGESFPEEARKIHYGEVEHRDIYGEASVEEASELVDEGVDIFPVPDPPPENA